MFYHLNELYGMTKWFDKFKIFSFTDQHVNSNLLVYILIIVDFCLLDFYLLI